MPFTEERTETFMTDAVAKIGSQDPIPYLDQPEPKPEEPLRALDDQPEPRAEDEETTPQDNPVIDDAPVTELRQRYTAAIHAMQTGVGRTLELDPRSGSPKHLRVGINAAMSDHAGLVKLLIEKGVFNETEYFTAIALEAEREQQWYEQSLGVKLA